jgi:hypothetical protein
VTVVGASITRAPDRDSTLLPAAGQVAVVARFAGSCESGALTFTVVGTDQMGVSPPAIGSAALIDRLPAGAFRLAGQSRGFTDASLAVEVVSGQTLSYEIDFEVDTGAEEPGCTAPGATCRPGLVCNTADGDCYGCLQNSDCTVAPYTACVNQVCHDPTAAGETCDPCTADANCETVASGPAAACGSNGTCTHVCATDADCPAGFACQPDGARSVCKLPQSCAEARDEFGGECFSDAGCASALYRSTCFGANTAASPPVPGYCTGPCSRADDCDLVPGFACNATSGLCQRIPDN